MSPGGKPQKTAAILHLISTGCCTLPGCGFLPGNFVHWLSFTCKPLAPALELTFKHCLQKLQPWPHLVEVVYEASGRDPEGFASFLADPSTDVIVIPIKQKYGPRSIWPLFKMSRSLIWCVHRETRKFKSLPVTV